MAILSKAQRSELRHIRNEQFKRNNIKGVQKRHPNKEATVYSERPNCVRLESRFTKRPNKSTVNYGDAPREVCLDIPPPKIGALESKLLDLGITKTQYETWRNAKRDGSTQLLADYIRGLK